MPARIPPVSRASDYPGDPAEIAPLFDALFPGIVAPAFDESHAGLAIAARSPQIALHLAKLSRLLVLDSYWATRPDLREIAIQTTNIRSCCAYGFATRVPAGEAAGLSADRQRALATPDTAGLNADQRLVADYAAATLANHVPDALFARAVATFGETAVVELSAIVAFWSFRNIAQNATRPGD